MTRSHVRGTSNSRVAQQRRRHWAIALMVLAVASVAHVRADIMYDLSWHTIDGGGGTSEGKGFMLSGTVGQPDAGVMSGGAPGNEYTLIGGFWAGAVGAAAPACPGDLNGDGVVDVLDLLILLDAWGPAGGSNADLNGDGEVDVLDLLILLDAWGPCPKESSSSDPMIEPANNA